MSEREQFEAWWLDFHTTGLVSQKQYAWLVWQAARAQPAQEVPDPRPVIEMCAKALAEELAAWDIDPPIHHIKEASDACEAWLAAAQGAKT